MAMKATISFPNGTKIEVDGCTVEDLQKLIATKNESPNYKWDWANPLIAPTPAWPGILPAQTMWWETHCTCPVVWYGVTPPPLCQYCINKGIKREPRATCNPNIIFTTTPAGGSLSVTTEASTNGRTFVATSGYAHTCEVKPDVGSK